MEKQHTFHIPVMGIGFSIDTPLKVAQYGIDSVISLVDDMLLEKLRRMYCDKYDIPYVEISEKVDDYRAKRITSYLNLLNTLAKKKFEELKNSLLEKKEELQKYFDMLPDSSFIKREFSRLTSKYFNISEIRNWIKDNLTMGSIDVNIMTKVDKANYLKGNKLPAEYNDAHAALRGYAKSELESSLILSAGMNPGLYGYIANFRDFYPDEKGKIKKKIALKVSDYRSAYIQGKYLAKKGLWVSEYRIESGLNCGGHAFATNGHLLGPILAEFRDKRDELIETTYEILIKALRSKNITVPENRPQLKITAQGGVGTAEEHRFLIEYYQIDSVGWGSPFLLVPEVTNVDDITLKMLQQAKEQNLYLSNISPLGVPFNSLKGNTKDLEKRKLILTGKPGSSCPKRFIVSNTDFTQKPLCTASRKYQQLKLKELNSLNLTADEYKKQFDKIVDKSCLCVGLGTTPLINNNIERKIEGDGVSICPGPNMAYFSEIVSLKKMVDHIYGRINIIKREDRPNMFIKELKLYIDFLKNKVDETRNCLQEKQEKYLLNFAANLQEGIKYYYELFGEFKNKIDEKKSNLFNELEESKEKLQKIMVEIRKKTLNESLAH